MSEQGKASETPVRILITALGGQGGGTLMNWLVSAARASGYRVQATSVPGVAQRTGSTSYYLEVAGSNYEGVFNLVPMPARVDVVVCSELMEAARVIEAGLVSPELTTLIASDHRVYSTAEKIDLADGRFDVESIAHAAHRLSRHCHLLDLQKVAGDHGTYISATLFGAVAASGALPWDISASRSVLAGGAQSASIDGFDAAAALLTKGDAPAEADAQPAATTLEQLIAYATAELIEYQDDAYAELYHTRLSSICTLDSVSGEIKEEVARRLANWMMYEDIPRVADLKTRRERYAQIKQECGLQPGQTVRITEYLKPRAEEIADMLPVKMAQRILRRVESGKSLPLLGKGRRIPSNSAWGYWMLRGTAAMKKFRRRSYRFQQEQSEIESWITALQTCVTGSEKFALALASLPRLRKGYSDTLQRGVAAYDSIFQSMVTVALKNKEFDAAAQVLQDSIKAALADDQHVKLTESIVQFRSKASLQMSSTLQET